jgi:hypothetical protein
MSNALGLGDSDAEARWIGIRRHQGLLVVVGFGFVSAWIMGSNSPLTELVAGVLLLLAAVPMGDGQTVAEVIVVMGRYVARSRWRYMTIREFGDDVILWAPSDVVFRAYELDHRGRLDLSGRDVSVAESLASLVDAVSAGNENQHVSQHVMRRNGEASTLLALPTEVPAPDGWRLRNALAVDAVRVGDATSLQLYERFTYLRLPDQLVRVFRVRDFSSVPGSRSLLEQILRAPVDLDLSVHVDVVAGLKAHRLAARAVHRVRSDEVTSSAAGFRRSARSSRSFERLAEREVLVAGGRSLLRLGVFVVVSAGSLEDLQRSATIVWRRAHDGGLRLERGRGNQYEWFRAQLPGGPGW